MAVDIIERGRIKKLRWKGKCDSYKGCNSVISFDDEDANEIVRCQRDGDHAVINYPVCKDARIYGYQFTSYE